MRVKAVQLASVLLSLSLCAGAQAAGKRSNFLVGGEFGVESRHTHHKYNYVVDPARAVAGTIGVEQLNQSRVTDVGSFLGLVGGWQVQCGRTLLGLEGNIDFHSFEESKQVAFSDNAIQNLPASLNPAYAATVKFERGTTYQITGRAGWWLMPSFMPFVRLGLQYSRDQIHFSAPARQVAGQRSFTAKEDVWSGVGGIGVEIPVFGPTSMRVEFNYIYSPSTTWTDDVNVSGLNGGVGSVMLGGSHRVDHPKSYVGKVAWVWNFE